ncbi:alcohol oxidase [Ramicandelaber brevisporus]|nr:alcohol oxidase [Ramicandelaber brevisporus]
MGFLAWLNFLLFVRSRVNKNPPAFASKTDSFTAASLGKRQVHPYNDLDVNAKSYDYVIIGGGTAGSVLANRLSADPSISVLVIEAGDSDNSELKSRIPVGYVDLFDDDSRIWRFHTEPEPEMNGRRMFWPRGKLLGGSSAVNAQMFQKCPPADYDQWEKEYGCTGWSWKDLKPYFMKFENFKTPMNHPCVGQEGVHKFDGSDPVIQIDSEGRDSSLRYGYRASAHGTEGPVVITPAHSGVQNVAMDFVDGCSSAGLPRLPDINDDSVPTFGASLVPRFITPEGYRSSASSAYLSTELIDSRPNLTVGTYGRVSRILFERHQPGSNDTRPIARGVEIVDSYGNVYQVRSKREIILCAGAVQSPQVMLLSGVGPRSELEKHGIPIVHELPGVGQNMQDHLDVCVNHLVPFTTTHLAKYKLIALGFVAHWLMFKSGFAASNAAEAYAFFNHEHPAVKTLIGENDEAASTDVDPAWAAERPTIEIISFPSYVREHAKYYPPSFFPGYASLVVTLLKPFSRGSITLHSADPLADPKIKANYLADKRDMDVLVKGIKVALKINQHMTAAGKAYGMYDLASNPSDGEIKAFIRERGETLYHPTSTCTMGPATDPNTVVDTDLRVHGISGLRIADASIIPSIVRGHTASIALAIGEKASDLVLETYKRETALNPSSHL